MLDLQHDGPEVAGEGRIDGVRPLRPVEGEMRPGKLRFGGKGVADDVGKLGVCRGIRTRILTDRALIH